MPGRCSAGLLPPSLARSLALPCPRSLDVAIREALGRLDDAAEVRLHAVLQRGQEGKEMTPVERGDGEDAGRRGSCMSRQARYCRCTQNPHASATCLHRATHHDAAHRHDVDVPKRAAHWRRDHDVEDPANVLVAAEVTQQLQLAQAATATATTGTTTSG